MIMANCIGKHKSPSSETNKVLVQFAKDVTDYSSQYGCENSISYVAYNLSGESSIYPNYGDFTQACVLVNKPSTRDSSVVSVEFFFYFTPRL